MTGMVGANIEQLHVGVTQLRQVANTVRERQNQIQDALTQLDAAGWYGRHRLHMESRWNTTCDQLAGATEELANLAARLDRYIEQLRAAGQDFGGLASAVVTADSSATSGSDSPGASDSSEPSAPTNAGTQPVTSPTLRPLPEGATTAPNVLPNLAGCTNYVASRVNLNDWGRWPNAHEWNDVARQAGYPVGVVPTTGSIMVFEPGVMGTDAGAGHVAYVEKVSQTDNHYQVEISEANPVVQNNAIVWGTHTPPTRRTLQFQVVGDQLLTVDGQAVQGVSFISGR